MASPEHIKTTPVAQWTVVPRLPLSKRRDLSRFLGPDDARQEVARQAIWSSKNATPLVYLPLGSSRKWPKWHRKSWGHGCASQTCLASNSTFQRPSTACSSLTSLAYVSESKLDAHEEPVLHCEGIRGVFARIIPEWS